MMPTQKPGRSVQSVMTPPEFVHAARCLLRIDEFAIDLAAEPGMNQAPTWLGPGGAYPDAFRVDWDAVCARRGWGWLNPPYAKIGPWARYAAESGARVAMLVPAATGSAWFREWVEPFAFVLWLTPRIKFVGHRSCYPKDLILALYDGPRVGSAVWRWK